MVKPEEILSIRDIVSKTISKAYDVDVYSIKILELDVSAKDGLVVVRGEWDSSIGKGRFEARIKGDEVFYLKLDI